MAEIEEKKEKKEPWYVYGVLTLVSMVITYFALTDYEGFIHPDSSGSGKSRMFRAIFNVLDSIGGKWFVLAILFLMVISFFVITLKRFNNRKAES